MVPVEAPFMVMATACTISSGMALEGYISGGAGGSGGMGSGYRFSYDSGYVSGYGSAGQRGGRGGGEGGHGGFSYGGDGYGVWVWIRWR